MTEKMTLEQVRDVVERAAKKLCNCGACKESKLRKELYEALNSDHLNAAKGEAVAWRYRFYGSQGWVYATAGEGIVCGLPLIYSQPLYSHPAEKFEEAPYTYAYRYPDGIRTGTGGREINGCKPTEVIPLYTNLASPDVVRDTKSGLQPISTAPDKTLVVVAWVDEDQEDRYEFDYKEDGVWIYHSERYEHYSSCAPRDIPCTGPSEEAPYTHWLELPIIDAAMAAREGGE